MSELLEYLINYTNYRFSEDNLKLYKIFLPLCEKIIQNPLPFLKENLSFKTLPHEHFVSTYCSIISDVSSTLLNNFHYMYNNKKIHFNAKFSKTQYGEVWLKTRNTNEDITDLSHELSHLKAIGSSLQQCEIAPRTAELVVNHQLSLRGQEQSNAAVLIINDLNEENNFMFATIKLLEFQEQAGALNENLYKHAKKMLPPPQYNAFIDGLGDILKSIKKSGYGYEAERYFIGAATAIPLSYCVNFGETNFDDVLETFGDRSLTDTEKMEAFDLNSDYIKTAVYDFAGQTQYLQKNDQAILFDEITTTISPSS